MLSGTGTGLGEDSAWVKFMKAINPAYITYDFINKQVNAEVYKGYTDPSAPSLAIPAATAGQTPGDVLAEYGGTWKASVANSMASIVGGSVPIAEETNWVPYLLAGGAVLALVVLIKR